MSETLLNSSYKLKKIHPIILKNDTHLLKKYLKEKKINSRNKKKSLQNEIDNNYIYLKDLISPNFQKIKEFRKKIFSNSIEKEITKNNKNSNIFTINNINVQSMFKKNIFKEEFNLQNTNYNNKIVIPNNNKIKIKKKEKYKINRSTNISIELNKIKNNYNSELDEDKIVFTENNDIINFNLYKSKQFNLEKKKNLFKEYSSPNNKYLNQKLFNRKNFITNIKLSNSKISNNENENILYNKTLNINKCKKISFKKNRRMQSLKENIVWNDYTKREKNKKIQQLNNKRKMKEEIFNMIKLFRDSYIYKINKNKTNMSNKEKYLNYLDDHSLGLRENIIKNNIKESRGGKQNLRKIYNPLNI